MDPKASRWVTALLLGGLALLGDGSAVPAGCPPVVVNGIQYF
jgi:hypothetical protein